MYRIVLIRQVLRVKYIGFEVRNIIAWWKLTLDFNWIQFNNGSGILRHEFFHSHVCWMYGWMFVAWRTTKPPNDIQYWYCHHVKGTHIGAGIVNFEMTPSLICMYIRCIITSWLGVLPARHSLSNRRINSSHGNNIFIFQGQRFSFFPSSPESVEYLPGRRFFPFGSGRKSRANELCGDEEMPSTTSLLERKRKHAGMCGKSVSH